MSDRQKPERYEGDEVTVAFILAPSMAATAQGLR